MILARLVATIRRRTYLLALMLLFNGSPLEAILANADPVFVRDMSPVKGQRACKELRKD